MGRAASTDPGLGGPPVPLATVTPGAMPVQALVGSKKDSVELLLEGMPLQQPPPPPRTTPQTAGQSSAAYHVEHSVRPAHTSPDDMPKVVVERAPQHATVRLDRARLQAVIDQAQAEKAALAQQREQAQQQAAAGMPMSLRIAIAIVAGLAVVLAIFLFARPAQNVATVGTPPPPAVTAAPTAAGNPTAQPSPMATSAQPVAADTASATPTAAPPASTSAGPRPRPRSTAPAAPAGTGDLGEFKTTFH